MTYTSLVYRKHVCQIVEQIFSIYLLTAHIKFKNIVFNYFFVFKFSITLTNIVRQMF